MEDRSRPKSPGLSKDEVAELYRRHSAMVLRRALRFLPRAEAEDLAHEVFMKLLERPDVFRGQSSPATWLYTVTTRLAIDRVRATRLHDSLLARNGATVWEQADPGTMPEARAFLTSLFRKVDPELALVGALYWADGLTTAQIGQMLGVSDRTIANRLEALMRAARELTTEEPR